MKSKNRIKQNVYKTHPGLFPMLPAPPKRIELSQSGSFNVKFDSEMFSSRTN